jgi:hypothetical protein
VKSVDNLAKSSVKVAAAAGTVRVAAEEVFRAGSGHAGDAAAGVGSVLLQVELGEVDALGIV